MPTTNASSVSTRQRNPREFSLSPAEEFRRDAILTQAYLRIVEAAVQPLERQYERLGKLISNCRRMARARPSMVPVRQP